jgi:hypothetical protein
VSEPIKVDSPEVAALVTALAAPFDPAEVKWKPAMVKGNRALAMCYIDARAVQDRLDEVLSVTGWQDNYEVLADGSVVCRLQLRLAGEWVTKVDVGSTSEQPDAGDRMKAAFSDALKRAAVKFGIGRYLYRLPSQWVDYDPQKKQFVRTPSVPGPAGPQKPKAAAPAANGAAPLTVEEVNRLLGLMTKAGWDHNVYCQQHKVIHLKHLSRAAYDRALKELAAEQPHPNYDAPQEPPGDDGEVMTPAQYSRLMDLSDHFGDAKLAKWAQERFGRALNNLTAAEAGQLIAGCERRIAEQKAGAASKAG